MGPQMDFVVFKYFKICIWTFKKKLTLFLFVGNQTISHFTFQKIRLGLDKTDPCDLIKG